MIAKISLLSNSTSCILKELTDENRMETHENLCGIHSPQIPNLEM